MGSATIVQLCSALALTAVGALAIVVGAVGLGAVCLIGAAVFFALCYRSL